MEARDYAEKAHQGQLRKYTGEPYIMHCAEVAQIVQDAGGTKAMIEAAWLHDTVEDTETTIDDIRIAFGDHVAELVSNLTDVSKPTDGNRKIRKAIDRDHLAKASADVQTIKLADIISNTKSIVEHDPEFSKVYLAEKRELLAVMTKGNAALFDKAKQIIGNSL